MLNSECAPPAWVADFYRAVDANDGAGARQRLAPDVQLQFGARPAVSGREAAVATLGAVHGNFESVGHEFRNVWQTGDGVICEFVATHRLHDGSGLSTPTLSVLERRAEQIVSLRVYIDEVALRERAGRSEA